MTHTIAINRKNPAQDIALATDRKVDVITVPTNRLENVARLIAFARMLVENTSAGISQAPTKKKEI